MNREYRRKQAKKMNTPQKLERVVNEVVKVREKEMEEIYNKKILVAPPDFDIIKDEIKKLGVKI